ncbi:hypothetical protein [Kitasatospora purpeofusca]|uniref:hypothetical protein n=1 Tax=Kitasatospora purpeofusca TaxID=67352 RepID=UPI0035E34ABA
MSFTLSDLHTAVTKGTAMTAGAAEQTITDDPFPSFRTTILAYLIAPASDWKDRESNAARLLADQGDPSFTYDQVSEAVNRAVDDTARHEHHGANDRDYLFVNAVLTLLNEPQAQLADIAASAYGQDPDTIRSWARNAA